MCACETILVETCDVRACGAFLGLRSAIATLHVFCVNYNSAAQKLRILAIKVNFDPKNSFLTNSIDDRIKIKTEITSSNMRYCINFNKVAVALASCDHQKCKLRAVAGAEGFWVAELRVRQLKIGEKSCFACDLFHSAWKFPY